MTVDDGTTREDRDGDKRPPVGWPSPWTWMCPHRVIAENPLNSGFDFGVDEDGDVLIRRDGVVGCVTPSVLSRIIDEAEEYR